MSKLRHELDGAVIRDETWAALKPIDAFGNPMLKRMGSHPFVAVAVQAGVRTREVPEKFWAYATDLHNHLQAVVDCQCGHTVVVDLIELKACPGCQRWFFFSHPAVFALNTPAP